MLKTISDVQLPVAARQPNGLGVKQCGTNAQLAVSTAVMPVSEKSGLLSGRHVGISERTMLVFKLKYKCFTGQD